MRPVFGRLGAIRHNFRTVAAFLWADGGKVGIAGGVEKSAFQAFG
jgi:hypothetical protein